MAWLSGKNKDKPVDVWVWLFNDLFLIGKPKKQKHLQESHRTASCFSTLAKLGLDEIRLINLSSLQGSKTPSLIAGLWSVATIVVNTAAQGTRRSKWNTWRRMA
jgi:hypothetical protein